MFKNVFYNSGGKNFMKFNPHLSALNESVDKEYTVYICDNYAAASRGGSKDNFYTKTIYAPNDTEVLRQAAWEMFKEYVGDIDGEITSDSDYEMWELIERQGKFGYTDYLDSIDDGAGFPCVYGIKNSYGKLIYDFHGLFNAFEDARLDEFGDEDEDY